MGGLVVLILTAALSVYFGFKNASLIYTALMAIASAFLGVVFAGWRAPDAGMAMSSVWGLIFTTSVCTLAHVIGYGAARLMSWLY